MPKLHDPDLLIARSRLERALMFYKKAQQDLYKSGQTDRGVWEGCLSELDEARHYVQARIKRGVR